MELQQLKYFKTVAAIGKISEAAEALFISAPALSTSISRLEKELGMPLFDRTSNRIILNDQGKIFLKCAERVFTDLENTKAELQQSLLPKGPHIQLLTINSLIWVNLIASFTAEFPQYTLSCSSATINEFAESGFSGNHNFLLAFRHEIPPVYAEKMESAFLFTAKPCVILHKDHPLAAKDILDVRELADQRIFISNPGASLHKRIKQLFDLHDLPLPGDNFNSHMVRLKMVAENKGISFTTYHPGNTLYPNIRYVPLDDPFEPWSANLYWRKDHTLSPEENSFLEFARQLYRDVH